MKKKQKKKTREKNSISGNCICSVAVAAADNNDANHENEELTLRALALEYALQWLFRGLRLTTSGEEPGTEYSAW